MQLKHERGLRRRVLEAFAVCAEPLPHSFPNPHCCLNASRVTIDALLAHGISARPMSVEFVAVGMKDGTRYEVMIDTEDEDGTNYPGHVVVLCGPTLIDPSCAQFNRPHKGISVPDVLVTRINPITFERGEAAVIPSPTDPGTLLYYRARPLDRAFFKASGFSRHQENRQLALRLTAAMKDVLIEQREQA